MNLQSLERLFGNATSACQQAVETLYSTMDVVREFAAENNLTASELAVLLGVSLDMADRILSGDDPLVPGAEGRHATPAFLVKAAILEDALAMDSAVLSIRELSARELEVTGDPAPDTQQRLDQQAQAAGVTLHWHVMAGASAGALHRVLGTFRPGTHGVGIERVEVSIPWVSITVTGDTPEVRAWAETCPEWITVTA